MNKKILTGVIAGIIGAASLTGLSGCNKSSKPELEPEESRRSTIHDENRLYINAYDLDIDIDTDANVLSYSITADIENSTKDTLNELVFRDNAAAFTSGAGEVKAAYPAGEKGAAFTFTKDETLPGIIRVALGDKALEPGTSLKVTLEAEEPMAENNPHLGVYSIKKYKEYALASCFLKLIEYRDGQWLINDAVPEPGKGFDDLAQVTDYHVAINTPSGFKAIGSGMESKDEDGITHLNAVDSRDFGVVLSDGFRSYFWSNNELNVSYYYIEGSKLYEESQTAAGSSATLGIDWANYYLGRYPWNQYDIVQLYDEEEALSYPGFMTYGGKKVYDGIPLGELASYSNEMKELFGKEVLNQWFYEITDTDQASDAWLTKGLKTWFDDFTKAKVYGSIKERNIREILDRAKQEHPQEMKMKLSDELSDQASADIVNEFRGAEFIESIYKELGEEEFLTFIKEYMEDFKLKELSTESFLKALEKHKVGDVENIINEYF